MGVESAAKGGMSGHQPGGEWFFTPQGERRKLCPRGDEKDKEKIFFWPPKAANFFIFLIVIEQIFFF